MHIEIGRCAMRRNRSTVEQIQDHFEDDISGSPFAGFSMSFFVVEGDAKDYLLLNRKLNYGLQ